VSLSLVIATGCIGRMALSGKVMKWNLEAAENKWGREVIFLCLYIIPVYPISGMIDLLIVNSIEFHTGTNPVSGEKRLARAGETRTVVAPDGTQSSSTLREDGSIDFEVTDPDGGVHSFNLQEHGDALVARDFQGHELARVRRGEEVVRVP
jgi:hypothetical protein